LQVIDKKAIMILSVAQKFPGTFFLRNLVHRRSLLFQLVRRDFEQRFVGSAMGWIWGLIHPLVLLASWVFIFRYCLNQSVPPGEVTDSYPLFLFAGMLPWMLFNETLTRSAPSLLEQANLITKTVFPAEMIPVAVFLSSLASHLLALTLMIAVVAVYLNQISIFLILLPVYIFVLGLLAVGLGWIVASLQVFLRDTAQILTVVLTFWFWLTPIFLAASQFPRPARGLLAANPMYYLVRAYRILLLSSGAPDLRDLAVATVFAAAVFIAGGLFFRHMKRGFADVL
jgi:lipopolysaccharide transport system permease protein